MDIVEKLKRDALLQEAWDGWEIGNGPAPPPLFHRDTAKLEREAAETIEWLRRERDMLAERCAKTSAPF